MRDFLYKIRKPEPISPSKKASHSVLIFALGVMLGVVSKALESTGVALPHFLEALDLRNFFSRMGVWLFFGVLISVYSKTPARAALNAFLFFTGMVGSYYLYTVFVAGFFPKAYMKIWIGMTVLTPLLAAVCWFARGKGIVAICIASIIFALLSRQAFAFGFWYFDIRYILELLLWVATIFVLYQSPKQILWVIAIGSVLYFLTAPLHLFWGML